MLFLELSIFNSITSHPMWPMTSLAKLLFLDMLFLAGLFLAHSKFNISCCTFFNSLQVISHVTMRETKYVFVNEILKFEHTNIQSINFTPCEPKKTKHTY
jgi:hypothetical protein